MAANGSLRTVRRYQPAFDPNAPLSFQPTATSSGPKVRPVSPISISEAAEAVRGRKMDGKSLRSSQPHGGYGREGFRNPGRALPQFQESKGPATPDTDHIQSALHDRRRIRRGPAQLGASRRSHPDTSPTGYSVEQQITPQTLSPRPNPATDFRSSYNETTPLVERQTRQEAERRQTSNLFLNASLVQDTPDSLLQDTGHDPDHVPQDRTIPASIPARLAIDSSVTHDLSLPSPSLSPVTAAANLQQQTNAFYDPQDTGTELEDSSFELSSSQFRDSQTEQLLRSRSFGSGRYQGNDANQLFTTRPSHTGPSVADLPAMFDFFEAIPDEFKTYVMYQLLRRCPKPTLHFVADVVNPALKCDFLALLPLELSLNIVKYLDVKSMCRASQVSKKWRHIINTDEKAWKDLFDRDGFTLPDGELQRAIVEGWGWQHPHGKDGWEQDISSSAALKSDSEWSSSSGTVTGGPVVSQPDPSDSPSTLSCRRPKRKAALKFSSRKQQKRKDVVCDDSEKLDSVDFMSQMASAEGPYAAANAAALAVPYPAVGLPSLKSLHLYKSLYQRHYLIRRGWMKDDIKPRHIAFRAHDRHVVTCLQFDTDKILTGSDDTNINVYDTKTGALRNRLQGHEGGVWALQYEGNVLVSGSTDRSVRVWDIEKGTCMQVFHGHTSTVRCLQILMPTEIGRTPDNKPVMMPKQPLIITGSRDSNLRVWKLPQPGDPHYFQAGPPQDDTDCPYFVRVLSGHQHSVRAIAAHADTLVSGSYDCTVRVWKISTGETVHRLQGHTQKVYSVVLDHKRNRCISGSMDNLVKIWSLDTGSVLFNLEGHSSLVGLLDLNSDRLVSAAADSTLRIWDPENGQCKSTLTAHTGAITCFQHDSQKVISGSDRTLKMWNVKTGDCVKDLLTDLSGVWQVKFNERRCVAAVQRNNLTYIEVQLPPLPISTFR
jgi:F-box and WD-40 domain protein CDC4